MDESRTTTFYELMSGKDELFLVRKGTKRPENKRAQTKAEPVSESTLAKPFVSLLVRTKSERRPAERDRDEVTLRLLPCVLSR